MSDGFVPGPQNWQLLASRVGHEPGSPEFLRGLADSLSTYRSLVYELRRRAVVEAENTSVAGADLLGHIHPATESGTSGQPRSPMRVVLIGRTMAGKSSLLAALSGSHEDRIGDGRQRFSRGVFEAAASAAGQIEVVDTPGVGALDGADDTHIALTAARTADVILWVNSSDSIQQESAAALKYLAEIGKPIIVVVNCRQSLEGVGKTTLLRFPERVFGNWEGLLDEVKRHLADVGVQPLEVVRVHALAAAKSLAGGRLDTQLREASRIDDLTGALQREHESHHEMRRILRFVDQERGDAKALACSLETGAATVRVQAERDRGLTDAAYGRLHRAVRATGEKMESDVEVLVGRHRDWHLTVTDFGKSLEGRWGRTLAALRVELQKTLQTRLTSLTDEIKSTIEQTSAEWSNVSHDQFQFRDLSDLDAVWGNRILRAGVGIGPGVVVMGLGALAGGPVGIAVAVLGGPVANIAFKPLKRVPDRIFQSKDAILRKRRAEVAKQLGPILDDLAEDYHTAIGVQLTDLHEFLDQERARDDENSAALDRVATAWNDTALRLRCLLSDLDRETASALLCIGGCESLATSVRRATRVPGVCIFVEFEQSASEEVLSINVGERLAGGSALVLGDEAASALSYARGLVDAAVEIVVVDETSALLRVDADIPRSITRMWSQGLSAHLGKLIQIEATRRAEST